MKKTFLSFLLIGSTGVLLAQQQPKPSSDPNLNKTPSQLNTTQQQPSNPAAPATPADPNTQNPTAPVPPTVENRNTIGNTPPNATPDVNTTTYSVTVPASVQSTFKAAYPAMTTVTWRQSGDWYSARYRDENGKLMEASYREDGKSFTREASPILRTYVSEEAVNKAVEVFGANIYAIATVKGSEGDMYNVTVIENGQSKTMWMNADGSTVMNPYRTEEVQQTNTNTAEPVNTQPVTQPAEPTTPVDNSATPADDGTQDDIKMDTQDDQQPVIEEGETSELDESGRLNKDAINNGKSSDDVVPEEE